MKRLFIALSFCCLCVAQVSAQDIFNEVMNMKNNYKKLAEDASKNIEERRIATFKYDAIWYLESKAGEMSEGEFGTQVAAMTDFVNLFLKQLKDAKNNQARQLVASKFKKASLENSLFNDTDKELIYAYVDNKDFLTQFSLDTDWVKALQVVGGSH